MRLTGRLVSPTGATLPLDATGPAIRLGRDPAGEVVAPAALYPKVSAAHARVEPAAAGGFRLVHLSASNKTLLNGTPVEGSAAVRAGDAVRLGFTGPTVEILALEADAPATDRTVQAGVEHLAMLRGTAAVERLAVGAGGVVGRERGRVQFLLDHPHVSRLHASLAVGDGRTVLADLGTANGTFVNGRRLTRPTALALGDRVDIGPFALRFDGLALEGTSRADNVELAGRDLSRAVTDRGTGRRLTLLDGVSLVVRPKEFVCLIGPSGSGKSTLLAMLSGRAAPDSGEVTVNGRDLYRHFAALKSDIAVVPQKDLLHDTLSVGAALRYTAELRLPADAKPGEVEASVGDILGVVGLSHRRATPIRLLSGGQLKRASLANELLCKPSLLFLDEVTSGLDEQTDREVMELFRLVAEGGKTVVCVTHSLANVEATCTLVAVLTAGGKLAFVGTPGEARGYFGVARLGDVYAALAARPAEEWRDQFRDSPFHRKYVEDRQAPPADDSATPAAGPRDRAPTRPLRQAAVLTRRYLAVWRGDRAALLALLGQSLLVAVLLAAVFGRLADVADPAAHAQRSANLLFLLGVTSFWLGCNTAAKELVKERVIYARERAVNLRADSYLASKGLVLTLIALAQVTLLFAVARGWCAPPGNALGQWATLALLAAAGTAVGLLVSALSRTEEVALALVPVVVIPQIVLAGVIAPLTGFVELLARGFVGCHQGQLALQRLLPAADRLALGLGDGSVTTPLLILVGHASVCAAVTLALLSRRAA